MRFEFSPSRFRFFSLLFCLWPGLLFAAELEDRTAIAERLTQYPYRWDGKDASGFADLFTEDAVMERWQNGNLVEGSRIEGRTAIFEYALASFEGRLADRQTRHHFSGLVFLNLTTDEALTENMALITHQTTGNAPVIRSSGIYRNNWRKTAGGWKISKRQLFTDSAPAQ